MLSDQETWALLKNGTLEKSGRDSLLVWVIEHEVFKYRAIELKPHDHVDLVWALIEARSVRKMRSGIVVMLPKNGTSAWFPRGNVRLSSHT
jgi:hypothetical protein